MKDPKNTLVLGASDNPSRYSFLAIQRLRQHGHPVVAIGKRLTRVGDVPIYDSQQSFDDVDTVTLYLNPLHQQQYYDYIVGLHPRRIIFNPGAENEELSVLARANNIQPVEACTLVMLATGEYEQP